MSGMEVQQLINILEAALLAAGRPLSLRQLEALFRDGDEAPSKQDIRRALLELHGTYVDRGIELREVASGYRIQVRSALAPWVSRLWEEKPPRYSRALLETLALIAYRQPITRGEIEEIRGVAVSSHIVKTLEERDWIKVVGHREVPGRPALFATTRRFLDYFNLQGLDELPTLAELQDLDQVQPELPLGEAVADNAGARALEQAPVTPGAEDAAAGGMSAANDGLVGVLGPAPDPNASNSDAADSNSPTPHSPDSDGQDSDGQGPNGDDSADGRIIPGVHTLQ
jgi:segregation and condensation protein B